MAFFVGKADDFVLDRGAVARSRSFDHARKQGGTMQVGTDDLVRLFVGVSEIAGQLFLRHAVRKIGKGINIVLPLLDLAFGIIDGASVHARGGTRFESPHRKTQPHKIGSEFVGGRESVGPRTLAELSRDHGAFEVHARGEDDGTGAYDLAEGGLYTAHFPVFCQDLRRFAL